MRIWNRCLLFCASTALLYANQIVAMDPSSERGQLFSLVAGEWIAKSVYAVAELDVAGHLLQGPKNISELSKLTQSNEESLYRLMRMLSAEGVFHEEEGRVFSNTPLSERLAKDHPQSMRTLILFYSKEMSQSWNALASSLKEGKPAFDLSFGQPVFGYFRDHPEAAAQFNGAMKEKSRAVVEACLKSYDFGKYSIVYDIGGGMGHFLAGLLKTYPTMKGTLFELPEVIPAAQKMLGSQDRCSFIEGDFFESVPKNGNAYLLKSIIHDWPDKDAVRILKKCHEAMKDNGRLVLVEPIVTSPNQQDFAKLMDVYMMVITGGKERTEEEFRSLLSKAGFSIESITPTETEFCIIEAKKQTN